MRRADEHARAIGLWGSFKGWLKRIQTKERAGSRVGQKQVPMSEMAQDLGQVQELGTGADAATATKWRLNGGRGSSGVRGNVLEGPGTGGGGRGGAAEKVAEAGQKTRHFHGR